MEQKDFETIQRYYKRRDDRQKIKRYHDRKNDRIFSKSFGKVLTDCGGNDIIFNKDAEWEENEHPRAKNGQFTSGSGSSGGSNKNESKEKTKETKAEEKKSETPFANVKIRGVKAKEFSDSVVKAKSTGNPRDVWRVTAHSEDELNEWYPNAKMFVAEDVGTYAVNDNGDIISLCKYDDGKRGKGKFLLQKAIEHGGKKLDSYSGNHMFYTRMGFEPVSWCEWDEKYAPDGWVKGTDEPEPIIFYKYTGKSNDEEVSVFLDKVKPSKDYEEAQKTRDNSI